MHKSQVYVLLGVSMFAGVVAEPAWSAQPRTDYPIRAGAALETSEEPPLGGAVIPPEPPAGASAGVLSYPATFFDEFQPATALDMVKRLPGFNFEPGDNTVRGFVGSLGNVLINGQRPASKSVLLEDILRGIPYSRVASIDVIRGGAPGINMQGQSVVANVIRSGGDMSTYSSEIIGMFSRRYDPGAVLRLETTRSTDRLSLSGALDAREEQQYGNSGRGEQIRRGPGHELLESSDFTADWRHRQFQLNGSADYTNDAKLLRVNVGGTSKETQQIDVLSPRVNVPSTVQGKVRTDIDLDQGEAGIYYEQPLDGDVTGRVLLLQSLERKTITADALNAQSLQVSVDEALKGESILRSSATWRRNASLTLEGGLEGAYNFLDVDAGLLRNGINVPLPTAKVKIEEKRGELFAEARWKLSATLSSDIAFRYETSTISQSGDSNARRSLSYPKPRVQLTWNVSEGVQVRGRIERTVSQLEFRDFASQASLDAGLINSGNADLRPETAWEFEGSMETRFWDSGVIVVGYTHSIVSDVVDLVPLAGFDTAGNLGDGTKEELSLTLAMPLGHIGIPEASVRVNSVWQWSKVDDPLTNESRRITEQAPNSGNVLISKQLPALASTLTYENGMRRRETYYRLSEIRTDQYDHFMRLYWDWTPRSDTVVRVMFNNFTGRPKSRWRTVFDGSRADSPMLYREDRHVDAERYLQLQVRRTF